MLAQETAKTCRVEHLVNACATCGVGGERDAARWPAAAGPLHGSVARPLDGRPTCMDSGKGSANSDGKEDL